MIHILIPFFNRKQLTMECLESFSKQIYSDYSITVVDDGSTDGSSEAIRSRFPNVEVIETKGGLWWAKSLNVGLERILPRTKDGDFVLIINQDTEVKPDYLEKILEASTRNHRALVGSVLRNFYDQKLFEKPTRVDWSTYSFLKSGYSPEESGPYENADFLTTRGVIMPVEVFKKIGLYTRLLPHHVADLNFSMKAKRAGFNLILSHEAIVYDKETKGKDWPFWTKVLSRRSASNLGTSIMLPLLNAPGLLKLKCVVIIGGRFIKELSAHLFRN
jgi:GT2 family glycosyltransferase